MVCRPSQTVLPRHPKLVDQRVAVDDGAPARHPNAVSLVGADAEPVLVHGRRGPPLALLEPEQDSRLPLYRDDLVVPGALPGGYDPTRSVLRLGKDGQTHKVLSSLRLFGD